MSRRRRIGEKNREISGAWPGLGGAGHPRRPIKSRRGAKGGNFCGPPRLIARDRRSAAGGGGGGARGTHFSPLFCFCRPPGDSALGYWVLSSRAPRLPPPSSCGSLPTTTFNPAPLSLDPGTAWTPADRGAYPGYATMHLRSRDVFFLLSRGNLIPLSIIRCSNLFASLFGRIGVFFKAAQTARFYLLRIN